MSMSPIAGDHAYLHAIDPAVFSIGPLAIRWYGLSYITAFAAAWLWLNWLARRKALAIVPVRIGDAMLLLMVGVVVGGRLGYVLLYEPSLLWTFFDTPPWWGVFAINRGGMASHGGLLGVMIAAWFIARGPKDESGARPGKVPALHVLDALALVTPIGLMLGRIANFINGELLGKIVAMPGKPGPWWSVRFPQEILSGHAPQLNTDQQISLDNLILGSMRQGDRFGTAYERVMSRVWAHDQTIIDQLAPLLSARHPSQLYQAFAEGVVLGCVLVWFWRKPRKPGLASALFLMVYGVLRITTEYWRLPDAYLAHQKFIGLSRGQWFSAIMVVGGILLAWRISRSSAQLMGGWMTKKQAH